MGQCCTSSSAVHEEPPCGDDGVDARLSLSSAGDRASPGRVSLGLQDARRSVRNSIGIYDPEAVSWQWKHRTGWRNYDPAQCARIEHSFQRGDSHVRLKSGKAGKVPMEIFFADMLQFDPISQNNRKVQRLGPDPIQTQMMRYFRGLYRAVETGQPRKEVFAQYAKRRVEQLKKTIDEKDYNVTDYYSKKGCWATIARSNVFFAISMFLVFANALWIGIDTEFNDATLVTDADIGFQVIEFAFCVAFIIEILVRFLAFANKKDCQNDPWFVLDAILVLCMALEIFVVPIIVAITGNSGSDSDLSSFSILRGARILRLTRLGRIVRLLRLVPEILTLLKGIGTALRSVFFTMMLLGLIIYIFGIIFKHQAEEIPGLNGRLFVTVRNSCWKLLLHGTFLDDVANFINDIGQDSWMLAGLFLFFILLSNYTIMNMVIGIICEVVAQVSRTEKEEAAVAYLKETLLDILECHDKDDDRNIHEDEFELLMKNPEIHYTLTKFGVDVNDLLSLKEMLFESRCKNTFLQSSSSEAIEAGSGCISVTTTGLTASSLAATQGEPRLLSFASFLEVVLRLRGGNSAKVTDIVELREFVRQRVNHIEMKIPEECAESSCTSVQGFQLPRVNHQVRPLEMSDAPEQPAEKTLTSGLFSTADNLGRAASASLTLEDGGSSGILALLHELCEEQRHLREAMKDVRHDLDTVLHGSSETPGAFEVEEEAKSVQ